jgi:hypothetical protein
LAVSDEGHDQQRTVGRLGFTAQEMRLGRHVRHIDRATLLKNPAGNTFTGVGHYLPVTAWELIRNYPGA